VAQQGPHGWGSAGRGCPPDTGLGRDSFPMGTCSPSRWRAAVAAAISSCWVAQCIAALLTAGMRADAGMRVEKLRGPSGN